MDHVKNAVRRCIPIMGRHYSVTAAYTCLLRICCLAADAVSFLPSRSLPCNGSTRYSSLCVIHFLSTFPRSPITTLSLIYLYSPTSDLWINAFSKMGGKRKTHNSTPLQHGSHTVTFLGFKAQTIFQYFKPYYATILLFWVPNQYRYSIWHTILNIKIITNKYEGKSVYRSQMDVKRKTRDIRTWKKNISFSTYPPPTLIHLSHRFTSASKQSFDCFISHSHTSVSTSSSSTKLLPLSGKHFRKISLRISFVLCPFCSQKTHNRMLLFDSTLLKHSCHFDYWNQPLIMRMRICYVECHGVGLYC
jgi:hypothetical protein